MAENRSGGAAAPIPAAPPLPKAGGGKSKGLDMWKKQQAKLTEPEERGAADVLDEADTVTSAPGLSFDPKGRHATPCSWLITPPPPLGHHLFLACPFHLMPVSKIRVSGGLLAGLAGL